MFHEPVLLKEMIESLAPRSGGVYFDGTLGGGGYAEAILEASSPDGRVFATDVDEAAIAEAFDKLKKFGGRAKIFHAGYADVAEIAEANGVLFDGAVLDLGVSSHQLDEAGRGFSFRMDGPLDMRMGNQNELTAGHVVNSFSAAELEKIFEEFGEERFARKIAGRIFERRGRLKSTKDLEEICYLAYPPKMRRSGTHPATRVFQALRIFVNGELRSLKKFLSDAPRSLKTGGRIVIASYHSLEDRIVKESFKDLKESGGFQILTKKPLRPSDEEINLNPRARSAKLRAAMKK